MDNTNNNFAQSDMFPGLPLDFELQLINSIEVQTKTIQLFHKSLTDKGFDNNFSNYATLLYWSNSFLARTNPK